MSKHEILKFEGTVRECLPNAFFKVKFENDHTVTATISRKIRRHNINILCNDRVYVEITTYDLSKGRIVYMNK